MKPSVFYTGLVAEMNSLFKSVPPDPEPAVLNHQRAPAADNDDSFAFQLAPAG
jgi:hypothetical protein